MSSTKLTNYIVFIIVCVCWCHVSCVQLLPIEEKKSSSDYGAASLLFLG